MKTPSETVQAAQPAFPHYFKVLPPGCRHVDVYRVLQLFEVTDPALQHAVKKLLCAGARGAKDKAQDVAEAIATLRRWQQMRSEEQDATDLGAAFDQMPDHAAHIEGWQAAEQQADRAAYLARWASAPAEATHLAQDVDKGCYWYRKQPFRALDEWLGNAMDFAGENLLGRVACEPRPRAEGER